MLRPVMSRLGAPRPRRSSRRLRIGIDAHAIGARKTGNERFVANLIPALRRACRHDLVLLFTDRQAARDWQGRPGVEVRLIRPSSPFVRIPISLPWVSAREGLDVLLVQYHGPPVLGPPLVTVVHDVAFRVHREHFDRATRLYMNAVVPATVRRSARVVTVSDFSRREIVRTLGVPAGKVIVAPNGVDPAFSDPAPRPSPMDPPFFLAVGNLQPRKNLVTLIRGYREMRKRHPGVAERLVIVGQEWFEATALYREASDLLSSGHLAFTGYLPDDELIGLLQRATAFAFPSLYEGFGLPVVEAMAVGTPCLVSDIEVMREVAGDAALMLPPRDQDAWAEALARVAGAQPLRAGLIEKGKQRASGFTWDRSARAVLHALEEAAH